MATKKTTNASDFIDVTLSSPINIAGVKTSTLRMREPTVGDHLTVNEMKGSEAVREIHFLANLCMVTPDDIKQLKLRDYQKFQAALQGFLD